MKLDKHEIFKRGLLIWTLATVFYFFENLLNISPGAMKPELSVAFNLSAADLGLLSSCYLWPYALMQIPAGMLMDHYGPRRLLTVAALFCSVGAGLFGMSHTLLIACLARVFIGLGASFAVVGCAKIASVWFAPNRFALFMGLMVAIGMSGAAFGLATVSFIINTLGWRQAMIGSAIISLILSMGLWSVIRDNAPIKYDGGTTEQPQAPLMQSLLEVISCPQGWLAAIYAGFMFVPTLAFGGLWGIPYLVEAHGFRQDSAGILVSMVFVGWVFGGPIYGWVSDHIGRRNIPMWFANISTLLITLWIIYGVNMTFAVIAASMFMLGFCSSGFIIAFAVTREKNRPEISGTAIGFINMLNTFSVATFQWLIGSILDWVSTDVVALESGKVFSLVDYQKALLCIPVCLVISLIVLIPVKETYCKVYGEVRT